MTDTATRPIPLVARRSVHDRSPARAGGAARLLLDGAWLAPAGPADPLGPAVTEGLAEHLARWGERPRGSAALLDLVEAAGLSGHGGAHVPATAKWLRALRATGPLTLVANAAESEPVSAKDGTLLRQRPHLVLDGLLLVAEALRASRVVVWLHGDDDGGRRVLRRALAERVHLHDGGRRVEVVSGPAHYLAGESSAIVHALAGGPALPTARRGDHRAGSRSLVHNVETLARVALLARGETAVATRLLTVWMPRGRAVLEVAAGESLDGVLADVGWPTQERPSAALLGGYGGEWVRWERVADLPVDEDALRGAGLSLGAGVVLPLPAQTCGLTQTVAMVDYLASMSARQCGPCLFGLPAIADGLAALVAGRGSSDGWDQLREDVGAVRGRGACHHPDGATRLVASAVATFADDLAAHAAGRPCWAAGHGVLPLPGVPR